MTDKPAPATRHRVGVIFYVVVAVALGVLIALGTWQVKRLQWKEDLLASIDHRIQSPPADLNAVLELWRQTADVDYIPVRLEGRYMHAGEQRFLATHNGQSGWYLYTPFELVDGRWIIVNRGFVPYALADPAQRPWEPVADVRSLRGLARNPLSTKPGWMVPENAPEDRIWYWKDHAAMITAMGLVDSAVLPFFVDMAATDGKNGPIGRVTRIDLPNNHLQYAITWFGLAGVLVVTAGLVVWRSRLAGRKST